MTRKPLLDYGAAEKRKFERVEIGTVKVLVLDSKGKQVGRLCVLGRGGFMMQPETIYPRDSKIHHFIIHEPEEDLSVRVNARVRYADRFQAGFEFVNLDVESAVEVGIIIGKYYEAGRR